MKEESDMKKFISLMISLMCVLSLVACGGTEAKTEITSDLVTAKDYLYAMYKDGNPVTPTDYTVVGVVNIGGVEFNVTWTADSETVKFVQDGKMVTVDVDEMNPEEVVYNLTATLSDPEGNTESVSFERSVPAAIIIGAGMSYEEIVEAAYTLQDGIAMEEEYRLFGTITNIDTPYSEDYKNITVTIQIGELADKQIMCYRLAGEGADVIAVGDTITVTGIMKNYKGTIEINSGWIIDFVSKANDFDSSNYTEMSINSARDAEKDALVKVDGVVAKVLYAFGMKPCGFYLVDETNSIYVYDSDAAQRVKEGNKVTVCARNVRKQRVRSRFLSSSAALVIMQASMRKIFLQERYRLQIRQAMI